MIVNAQYLKNMPLFKELETIEIVWLIKRFKSNIFLPDDYIIK